MATYTVRAGDTWLSLSQKLYGSQKYAKILRQANRGTTLARGVVIRTGGARYTRPTDINPWGLGVGIVPTSAYETEAGTKLAKKYLGAIGQPGAVSPTEEVPGIAPVGERPPAELAPQALRGDVEGAFAPGFAAAQPTPVEGFTSMETLARQTGLYTPPATTTGRRRTGAVPYEAVVPAPYIPPPRPDIPEGLGDPGQYVMGRGSPWYQDLETPFSGIFEALHEMTAPEGFTPTGGEIPSGEEIAEAPYAPIPQELPPARYPYGTSSAARYTAQMMREGQIPGAVSTDVASMLGMSTQLLQNSGYVWDETSGLWHYRPEVTAPTTTGYGGGGGRKIQFARRGVGGGQSPYGSGFKSNLSGLIDWRRAFGG